MRSHSLLYSPPFTGSMSCEQYQRDVELFAAGVCPVCSRKVGKAQSRHAMVQHFYRYNKIDSQHALYSKTSYKHHFRHGRLKESLRVVAAN
jgi:hypothetical protein